MSFPGNGFIETQYRNDCVKVSDTFQTIFRSCISIWSILFKDINYFLYLGEIIS